MQGAPEKPPAPKTRSLILKRSRPEWWLLLEISGLDIVRLHRIPIKIVRRGRPCRRRGRTVEAVPLAGRQWEQEHQQEGVAGHPVSMTKISALENIWREALGT